jgi:hypothetical protein
MILSKNFYKSPHFLKRIILSWKMRKLLRKKSFFEALALSQIRLPQYFFYSARLKTVPRYSGNLQLLSNWHDLERLPSICPTNAISVTSKMIEIDSAKCIACGLCVEFSPEGLLLTGIPDPERRSPPGV